MNIVGMVKGTLKKKAIRKTKIFSVDGRQLPTESNN